ncbi:lasso peptide isopeptide bond-forming cyclase [Aerosakkonemataceae cyanobacterium BLCC-F50]|uniref:asparagine synthase (glutamine-hydrolyzing) n=1 Tax=Floridaenema flaviceps BLCC-F50 TaxID=3153642 RepID=A0ABV4XVK9_9CYAN
MSGIVGIYYFDSRPVDYTDIGRMVEMLAHRGPDGSGVWSEGSVGLGHRMLWTTPESLQEQLPFVDRVGNLVITADARIDNRDELLATLNFSDRLRGEISDSELILAAYQRWGKQCLKKLLGDFAFAIWDRQEQVLFCARDHFGVKPFYYYYQSGKFLIFASEIKALFSLPYIPCRLNEVRVADYLIEVSEDKVITSYQDVFRLPPAHSIAVSQKGIKLDVYWTLDPSCELRLGSNEEYAEKFREIFKDAVQCRLRSAFPIGSLLSGGLDSSSITCLARELLAEDGKFRLHTFSAIFENLPECDERHFISAVLAKSNLESHYLCADQLSPLVNRKQVLWHQDEVFYAPNFFILWSLCNTAHQHNVRILLNGHDGDTTVSHGIAYLNELAVKRRWLTLTKEVKGLARHSNNSALNLLFHYVWCCNFKPLVPEPIRQLWRAMHGRNRQKWGANTIINPDFAQSMDLVKRIQILQKNRWQRLQTSREAHWLNLTSGVVPLALEIADTGAAAFAIESRYPFFDKRLVEFCLMLPPEQKIHQGWTRIVMRRGMIHILPDEVRWRGGKTDLSPNFFRGLLRFEKELLEEVIFNNPKPIERYVNVPVLCQKYERYKAGKPGNEVIAIWRAVTLALWLGKTVFTS